MRLESSPSSSPARKRQRLSSPTYDEQLLDLSQEDLEAFDAMEANLSQPSQPSKDNSQNSRQEARSRRVKEIADALSQQSAPGKNTNATPLLAEASGAVEDYSFDSGHTSDLTDDPDNPFVAGFTTAKLTGATFSSASALPMLGFSSASNPDTRLLHSSHDYDRSPSPEAPPEQDYDSWFQPISTIPPVTFQSAAISHAPSVPVTDVPASAIGFMKASNKAWVAPSSVALAKAQEKMNEIWQDGDVDPVMQKPVHVSRPEDAENAFKTASSLSLCRSPLRPALRAVENSFNSPGTPTPGGFSRPSVIAGPSFSSPTIGRANTGRVKPFRSPFLKPKSNGASTSSVGLAGSPLNPGRLVGLPTFATARSQHPLAPLTAAVTMPQNAGIVSSPLAFATPIRPSRVVQRVGVGPRTTPAPFVTPFKPGMKPGQPGRLGLEGPKDAQFKDDVARKGGELGRLCNKGKQVNSKGVFDLTIPPNRKSLESSGLSPVQYTHDDLDSIGMNITELMQITPSLAIYYSFHTPTTTPLSPTSPTVSSSPPVLLGPSAALDELLNRGCTLATKPWVDNHWCLILWKLAGMVTLDSESENDPKTKRWCWTEVIRQLLYRYERELNEGMRPPLRLIATQDAPAAYPMVLCVSNITWSEAGLTDSGIPIEPHPELEVTDGWYRLRAQVDAPLARAIRRGILRVGRKIGVAGARLSSERKDPTEVLEAYNSTKLVISGNSSHLISWHTKLGFQAGPSISTLHSLTADGGTVSAMDLVVVKAYPVAFLEFIEDEKGQKHREGPRSASEEARANEQWMRRQELEVSKLRAELDKKLSRYEGYIDRLERRAGARFQPGDDDSPPDNIDNLYDELEDPTEAGAALARLSSNEAGWLARYIRDHIEKERGLAGEAIDQELKNLCPPREVRSFRVLVVQDAHTCRRPANRKAQLTVWDVLNLSLSEGTTPGTFEMGQRYMVTNLIPTQQGAWMDCEPGSEVYLSTRRDSRWTIVKP